MDNVSSLRYVVYMICSECNIKQAKKKNLCATCYNRLWQRVNRRDQYTLGNRFQKLKQGAKSRGIEVRLSLEEFRQIACEICYYCGASSAKQTAGGLDRINNNLPYTPANVVPACAGCNLFKHNRLTGLEMKVIVGYLRILRNKPAPLPLWK